MISVGPVLAWLTQSSLHTNSTSKTENDVAQPNLLFISVTRRISLELTNFPATFDHEVTLLYACLNQRSLCNNQNWHWRLWAVAKLVTCDNQIITCQRQYMPHVYAESTLGNEDLTVHNIIGKRQISYLLFMSTCFKGTPNKSDIMCSLTLNEDWNFDLTSVWPLKLN